VKQNKNLLTVHFDENNISSARDVHDFQEANFYVAMLLLEIELNRFAQYFHQRAPMRMLSMILIDP